MSLFRMLTLSLAAAGTVALSATAHAANRNVTIINKTKHVIVSFYASNVGSNDWEEDILDTDMLKPGQRIQINIDDGTGYCKYDFKALFDDGDEVIQKGVNVCEIGEFSFTQ